jgi:hypothetical protein
MASFLERIPKRQCYTPGFRWYTASQIALVVHLSCGSMAAAAIAPTCVGEPAYLKRTVRAVRQSLNSVRSVEFPPDVTKIAVPVDTATLLNGYALERKGSSGSILIIQ